MVLLLKSIKKSIKKSIITIILTIIPLYPNIAFAQKTKQKCQYKTFNIAATELITISSLIDGISDLCSFSTITKDLEAKKILDKKLNGINIKNMSLYEIFDLVLLENGIMYTYKNKILKLWALETKTFKVDYITSIREGTATLSASVDVEPIVSGDIKNKSKASENEIKVRERFDFWATLNEEIKALLNNGSESFVAKNPIINTNTGLVTITATKPQLDRIEKYLDQLKNRLHKQVLIDVSIIAVELSNDYTTGIDWSKFQLSINKKANAGGMYSSTGKAEANFLNTLNNSAKSINIINSLNFSMEGLINFIKKKGNSKILSNPKVITLNNQQALITIGDNINYRVIQENSIGKDKTSISYTPYSVFIGVLLNILPEVSDDDKIMLRINPSLSNFKYSEDDQKQVAIREIAPDTLEKKLSTVVRVNDGDTIILGGLIGQTKGKNKSSVPLLGDLPIVGNAFKSTQDIIKTTELVFVITPHILNKKNTKDVGTSLKNLGFSESLYE
ncbi:MAG: pilus (MSHA type) biogenesis protein MshL [Proteobacteria bacterium]|nr:MAG: pilus (MSHA type) biogenesis protein MshL [Pseudomonadota bacterium]